MVKHSAVNREDIGSNPILGEFMYILRALISTGRIFDLHSEGWWFKSTRALYYLAPLAELVDAPDLKFGPFIGYWFDPNKGYIRKV